MATYELVATAIDRITTSWASQQGNERSIDRQRSMLILRTVLVMLSIRGWRFAGCDAVGNHEGSWRTERLG
ncbi:MAG: hypothetical protein AAFP90_24090, partial [Planctomycetota bacterium]